MKDNGQEVQGVIDTPEKSGGQEIRIPTKIDPRLNPDSPSFDPAAYQAILEANGGVDAMIAGLRDSLKNLSDTLEASLPPREFLQGIVNQSMSDATQQAIDRIVSYIADLADHLSSMGLTPLLEKISLSMEAKEEEYQHFLSSVKEEGFLDDLPTLGRLAKGMTFIEAALTSYFDLLDQMGDYLEAELSRPEYENLTMKDMLQPLESDPNTTLWEVAIRRAEDAMKTADPERYKAMMEARRQQDQEKDTGGQEEQTAGTVATKAPLAALAPLASMPNGEAINFLVRVYSTKGGRVVGKSPENRHEEVTAQKKGDKLRFTRVNKQSGTAAIVEIDQANTFLSKTNKTFIKMLVFTMQKMTAQNFPLIVGFSLQELVDVGMYANTDSARKAVRSFADQITKTTISGTVKKGNKTIREDVGNLIYHIKIESGFVKVFVNENFNMDFIAPYFTMFPRFAYSLGNNAFSLVRYVFFLARQNSQAIKDKGTFTINLDAIRDILGLPPVDEVKNRKYRQYIITPIEEAIEEIEEALQSVPEAREYGFTLTPHGTDTTNIYEWLQGYLEIGLKGDFAETFVRLAKKAEKDRDRWERAKLTEQARQAVREEAKAVREAGKKKKS